MLKQLQKLGLFFWKDGDEDTKTKNDKVLKYLYLRTENSLHWKIKNDNSETSTTAIFFRQYPVDLRKKSKELIFKEPRKRELKEAGTYFVPPKEIRRHRKHSLERSPRLEESRKQYDYRSFDENRRLEERRSRKRNGSIKIMNKDVEENLQLTKTDIFKFINILKYIPKSTGSTSFLKRFLDSSEKEPVRAKITHSIEDLQGKPHHYKENDFHVMFMPSTSSAGTRSIKHHKKENRERTADIIEHIDIVSEKDLRKQKYKNNQKYETSCSKKQNENIFEELHNKKTKHLKFHHNHDSKTKLKRKALISKEIVVEGLNRKLKNHLVKNTFSLVDIPPTFAKESDVGKDSCTVINNKHETFSNRHKMFQYKSQCSDQNISKISSKKKGKGTSDKKRDLTIENHVSAVIISPKISRDQILSHSDAYFHNLSRTVEDCKKKEKEMYEQKRRDLKMESLVSIVTIKPRDSRIWREASSQCNRDDEEKNTITKATLYNSKTSLKAIDSKRRQSSTLFILKPLKENSEEDIPETAIPPRNRSLERPKKKTTKLKTKTASQSSISYLGPVVTALPSAPSGTAEGKPGQSTESKVGQRTSKLPTRKVALNSEQNNLETPKTPSDSTSSTESKITKSKSETKLQRKERMGSQKKNKSCDRSISNSSSDPLQKEKTFFATKSFKDEDKLNRLQKQKEYSDNLRKRRIKKSQKSAAPPQVMQVMTAQLEKDQKLETIEISSTVKEFCEDDLPQPCLELVECDKFKEIFESPVDEALNKILSENYDFLSKDFSFKINDFDESDSSEANVSISSGDLMEKETDAWYDFKLTDNASLSEISLQTVDKGNITDLNLDTKDCILDSLSPPGSEESGYTSMNSRQNSRNFFEQPDIKALLTTPVETKLSSHSVELERKKSSTDVLVVRSISKPLQASIDCSQKPIQLKLSKEEISQENKVTSVGDGNKISPQAPVKNTDTDDTKLLTETACVLEKMLEKISEGSEKTKTKLRIRNIRKKFKMKCMSCISCGSSRE